MTRDPHTVAIHGDAAVPDGPDVAPPLHVATTYDRRGQSDLVYRRHQHPPTERLEAVLGALDGGQAIAYPSGMAAIAALFDHLRPDRVALPADLYHGTREYVDAEAARGSWALVDPADLEPGDVWWVETPSNPKALITDIAASATQAEQRGVVLAVDATFATPVLLQPLALGAAYVMHSTTKFIGGHSDAMGGVLVAADERDAAGLRATRERGGAVPGSLDAWLTLRGVRTLPVRIERQSATAQIVAEHLAARVPQVWYPGLPGHPGHDIARRQMAAFGAVLSFEMADYDAAQRIMARLELFRVATSLGGVESLAEHRATVDATAPPGLIRLSIGLEAPADLIADLDQALG